MAQATLWQAGHGLGCTKSPPQGDGWWRCGWGVGGFGTRPWGGGGVWHKALGMVWYGMGLGHVQDTLAAPDPADRRLGNRGPSPDHQQIRWTLVGWWAGGLGGGRVGTRPWGGEGGLAQGPGVGGGGSAANTVPVRTPFVNFMFLLKNTLLMWVGSGVGPGGVWAAGVCQAPQSGAPKCASARVIWCQPIAAVVPRRRLAGHVGGLPGWPWSTGPDFNGAVDRARKKNAP